MSKELDYIADLEKENRIIKSILYCTKRSCNNCGKVNCENFQRQRIDCCGLWVSYKDYIKELEQENAELKSVAQFQQSSNMKRHFEIQELEKKNKKLESDFRICEKNADTYYDQLTKAKEIILKLYNAGRDVLMCRAEEKAYDNLSNAINDKSIGQFLQEIKK